MSQRLVFGFTNLRIASKFLSLPIIVFLFNPTFAQKIDESNFLFLFNGDSVNIQMEFKSKKVLFVYLDGSSCTGCNLSLAKFLDSNIPKNVKTVLIQKYGLSVENCRMKIAQSKEQFGSKYPTYFVKINEGKQPDILDEIKVRPPKTFEYYPNIVFYDFLAQKIWIFEYRSIFTNVYINSNFKKEIKQLF